MTDNLQALLTLQAIENPDVEISSERMATDMFDMLIENPAYTEMDNPSPDRLGLAVINEMIQRGYFFNSIAIARGGFGGPVYEPEYFNPQWDSQITSILEQTLQSPDRHFSNASVDARYTDDGRFEATLKTTGQTLFSGRMRDTQVFELAASQAQYNPTQVVDSYARALVARYEQAFRQEGYGDDEIELLAGMEASKHGFLPPALADGERESVESKVNRVRNFLEFQAMLLAEEQGVESISIEELAEQREEKMREVFYAGDTSLNEAFRNGRVFGLFSWLELYDGRGIDLIGANNIFPVADVANDNVSPPPIQGGSAANLTSGPVRGGSN